jgi:hypothetical protein
MTDVSAEWRTVRALRDELGPWPADEDAATPAAMYRAALVQATVTLARRRRPGLTLRERAVLNEQYVADWQVAALFHALMVGPLFAPDVARRVWGLIEDGGTCDELLWQWMTEAGLRPDELVAAVAAAIAAEVAS